MYIWFFSKFIYYAGVFNLLPIPLNKSPFICSNGTKVVYQKNSLYFAFGLAILCTFFINVILTLVIFYH